MNGSSNSEATKKPPKSGKQIVIHIDRKQFKVEEEELIGSELRALPDPDVGPEFDLWLEVPGGEDERIENEEPVKLRNGMHFFTAPSVINPGRSC
jgi:Multiubiquitin